MTRRILLWAGVGIALSLTVAVAAWLYARSTTAQLFGERVDRGYRFLTVSEMLEYRDPE
jgi:hypothetical protein